MLLRTIPRYPRKIGTAEVADRLSGQGVDVHRRTIQRDLESLATIFPLDCDDRDKPYGWSWAREAPSFDIPAMDPGTALTFRLVHDFMSGLLPKSALARLAPHFTQADVTLSAMGRDTYRRWPDKVRVINRGQALRAPDVDPEVMDVVYESLLEGKRFEATYRRRGEKESVTYPVNPLGLVFHDRVLTLVCTMREHARPEDVRKLLLHRMIGARRLDHPGLVPKGFTLDGYLEKGAFAYPRSDKTFRLSALFENDAALHLRETPLGDDQKLTEVNADTVRVDATVQDTAQLRWWLLGFGGRIEVLKPASLRAEIRAHGERMAERYRK